MGVDEVSGDVGVGGTGRFEEDMEGAYVSRIGWLGRYHEC